MIIGYLDACGKALGLEFIFSVYKIHMTIMGSHFRGLVLPESSA